MPKISELPNGTTIFGDEQIPIVQYDETVKIAARELKGYRIYCCLIYYSQINDELEILVQQNDGFTINASKNSAGIYTFEDTSSPFIREKTFVMIQQDNNGDSAGEYSFIINTAYRENDDIIKVKVNDIDFTNNTVYNTDNIRYCSLEIRVYS